MRNLNVTIIKGPRTEENIQKCYHILAKHIRREMQAAEEVGLTYEEYLKRENDSGTAEQGQIEL